MFQILSKVYLLFKLLVNRSQIIVKHIMWCKIQQINPNIPFPPPCFTDGMRTVSLLVRRLDIILHFWLACLSSSKFIISGNCNRSYILLFQLYLLYTVAINYKYHLQGTLIKEIKYQRLIFNTYELYDQFRSCKINERLVNKK